MQGLQDGITSQLPALRKTLTTVADTVQATHMELDASLNARTIRQEQPTTMLSKPEPLNLSEDTIQLLVRYMAEILAPAMGAGVEAGMRGRTRALQTAVRAGF